jgi:NCS1 family nucleobase:cation symporter-1
MVAFFLFFLLSLTSAFFRPHQMKWLLTAKAITQPIACFGIFIWALVRSGGPGSLALTENASSSAVLAWSFVGAINAAINGEFGPLIASDCMFPRSCSGI